MSRNWTASDNPPRHWKPTARHLRQVERAGDFTLAPGSVYVPLEQLAPNARLAFAEGCARFVRLNPKMRGV